jgi:hypothetical protein
VQGGPQNHHPKARNTKTLLECQAPSDSTHGREHYDIIAEQQSNAEPKQGILMLILGQCARPLRLYAKPNINIPKIPSIYGTDFIRMV